MAIFFQGESVFHYGPEADAHWSNIEFHQQLALKNSHLIGLQQSWLEQRQWGVKFPLDALPLSHPVLQDVEVEFAHMTAIWPDLTGFSRLRDPQAMFTLGGWRWQLGDDGSVVYLSRKDSSESWASTTNPLALLRYQTLELKDFEDWQAE